MAGPIKYLATRACVATCCLSVLVGIVSIIVVLASIKTFSPEDQVVIHYLAGKETIEGKGTRVLHPFRRKEWRKGEKLGPTQYMRIMNQLTGSKRVAQGPDLVFLGAYEESEGISEMLVLKKDQYIRFVDALTGTERVLKGPQTIVPGAWEESAMGIQQAKFVNRDTAVIVLNKVTGNQTLYTTAGVFFPDAYEDVVEERTLVRVLPHETMIVRNKYGNYVIYSGAGGNGTGTSFFLGPYDQLVEQEWSVFSAPSETNPIQTISKELITRIDMRVRKVEYQYEVRTNDNVNLRLQGTIFWKVIDVATTISMTDDPTGDVWHHARSALIQAVSKTDLDTFMKSFQALVQEAFVAQAADGFYNRRGVMVESMEVTKYEPVDAETAATLQEIIQETTDRINRLQAQRSQNDVEFAKLQADIELERQRTFLIQTQAFNERLAAEKEGEARGAELAKSATTFIDGLNSSLPSVDSRVELYKLHKQLEAQNEKTKHIASGKATLFLTPEDMNLNLNPLTT